MDFILTGFSYCTKNSGYVLSFREIVDQIKDMSEK